MSSSQSSGISSVPSCVHDKEVYPAVNLEDRKDTKPEERMTNQSKSVIDKPSGEADNLSEARCDNKPETSNAKLPSVISSCDATASENIVTNLQLIWQPDIKKVRTSCP